MKTYQKPTTNKGRQNFQHNLSQRDKNLTKQKLATPRPKPEHHKKSSHNPKTWTHDAKIWHQT
ncbi:hypothetical protein, partial [Gordonia aichiensis]|uniref:hypothetical protein n=1 Tax=Gordonia aichiensis TaxID=36820 RepID=UPI001C3F295B